MRIGDTREVSSRPAGIAARAAVAEPQGRALVVMAPAPTTRQMPDIYRQAAFLAHLIATKEQAPQTRERRRAEPGEALAAYRAAKSLIQ
jgi:hypothetical protein